jgi:hypothetical protein
LFLEICVWKREADGKCATPRFADETTKMIKESLAVVEAAHHVLVANEIQMFVSEAQVVNEIKKS